MKCFVILTLLWLPTQAFARQGELLKCLGAEERRLHLEKKTGPVYDLNQRLIGEMLQVPRADVKPEFLKEICASKFSPSWKLLELSLKNGKDLMQVPSSVTGLAQEVSSGMIEDYLESTREIFLNFITAIQIASPSATCLKEEIPQLDAFFTEIKHLQEDVDMKNIFKGKDQKIFDRLKDYPSAFDRCRERLKKKAKSASEAPAKKP